MTETVSSAIVQETVNQFISGLVQKYEERYESDTNRNLERLEMAQIKLEAAQETSYKWQITDASLLHWRRKLKCVTRECRDTLHKGKKRILEDKQKEQAVSNSPLPNRIVYATKSFVFSIFNGNNELRSSIVRRFEWFASGASEFLRFVELGGTPCRRIPFQSLVSNLYAGMELYHTIFKGNEYPLFRVWLVPKHTTEYGIVALLIFIQNDSNRPEGNMYFSLVLQLSDSTDIVGIAIKCLHLLAPHLKCIVENTGKELTRLYTQNFSWVPSVYSCQKEHLYNLYSLDCQMFRPDPLCCKHHDQYELRHISNPDIVALSDASLEPVVEATFHTFLSKDITCLHDGPYLRAGISFAPHGSLKGILPANRSSAIVAVAGEQQCTEITLEQLEEIMLPMAIDYFRKNADATEYQMIWKSEHGYALIRFERVSINAWRTFEGARKRKLLHEQNQELRSLTHIISHWIKLWGAYMPVNMRSFFLDWIQKEKEGQFAARHPQPYDVIPWMVAQTYGRLELLCL